MQVTSLNCWGVNLNKNRFRAIAEALLARNSDIIVLQEVVFWWQVQMLRHVLCSEYTVISSGNRAGLLNRGGLCIAVHKKFVVEQCDFTPYVRQALYGQPLTWSDALLNKGWQTVRVVSPSQRVTVFNTHLLGAYGRAKVGEQEIAHAQRTQLLSAVAQEASAVVVCGDFNAVPETFVSSKWSTDFSEAFALSPTPHTVDNKTNPLRQGLVARISGRGRTKPNKRIDYIFYNGLALFSSICVFDTVVSCRGYDGFLSDHFGIEALFI